MNGLDEGNRTYRRSHRQNMKQVDRPVQELERQADGEANPARGRPQDALPETGRKITAVPDRLGMGIINRIVVLTVDVPQVLDQRREVGNEAPQGIAVGP